MRKNNNNGNASKAIHPKCRIREQIRLEKAQAKIWVVLQMETPSTFKGTNSSGWLLAVQTFFSFTSQDVPSLASPPCLLPLSWLHLAHVVPLGASSPAGELRSGAHQQHGPEGLSSTPAGPVPPYQSAWPAVRHPGRQMLFFLLGLSFVDSPHWQYVTWLQIFAQILFLSLQD